MPKRTLRGEVRTRLQELTEGERREYSRQICAAVANTRAWENAMVILLFAPLPLEPDIDGLWAFGVGKRFCYPKISGKEMVPVEIKKMSELVLGKWNLREPSMDGPKILPHVLDLILVPGVAFSEQGERLGRGGGFYDRFLAEPELQAKKIGICFDLQIRANLPTEAHDCPVDGLVTESRVVAVRDDRL